MPGHSIAAVREIKSSLWATAGGKEPNILPKRSSQAWIMCLVAGLVGDRPAMISGATGAVAVVLPQITQVSDRPCNVRREGG